MLLARHLAADQIKKNELDGTCGTMGVEEKCVQNKDIEERGAGTLSKEITWKI